MSEYLRGESAVVTGAASGIGRALALACARRGARLMLADIDLAGMEETRARAAQLGAEVRVQATDVARAEDVERLAERTWSELGEVGLLANVAGIAVGGALEHLSLADWQRIVGVNFWGVVHGCHYFYPRMMKAGRGAIANMASIAALAPLPTMTPYCATKSAVLAFSETLRLEAAWHGVNVLAVCPSAVATNMARAMKLVSGTRRLSAADLQARVERMSIQRNVSPDWVAERMLRALERRQGVLLIGPETYALDAARRLSRSLLDRVMRHGARFMHDRL